MPPSKGSASGKKQPSRGGPADLPSALRRSARVQKRSNEDHHKPASPEGLIQAAQILYEDTRRSKEKKVAKRVSFEGQDPAVSATQRATQTESHPRDDMGDSGRQTDASQVHVNHNTQTVAEQTHHLAESSLDQPRRSSLPPRRAARLKRLIAKEIIAAAKAGSGTKRPYDGDRPATITSTNPAKRLRGQNATTIDANQRLSNHPVAFMLSQLGNHPHPLTLPQMSTMFDILKDRIFGSPDSSDQTAFSEKYFSFVLSSAQIEAWPLHELKTKYILLYMSTKFLADGSQQGWRNFFTRPESRQHLVSAILAEWFTQRIFKHTAFGFPDQLVNTLEDKDREYLHYDAIVRTKERANMIQSWLEDWQIHHSIQTATSMAVDSLAEELLAVLHPLLPPPLFDPSESQSTDSDRNNDGRKDSIALRKRQQLRCGIKVDLMSLIQDCAALHIGIRLTGHDGTIVRMIPHMAKGTPFASGSPFEIVNEASCDAARPTASTTDPSQPQPQSKSRLRIKMTCWPRIEAVVPEGPDMQELEATEQAYRQQLPPPQGSSDTDTNHDLDLNADDPDPFTWDDKDHHWPIVPSSLQDTAGRQAGLFNPTTQTLNTPKRAAYVRIYPSLSQARVYCERDPSSPSTSLSLSLDEAIAHARKIHPTHHALHLEDLQISLWNTWATYGGLAQWAVLLTATTAAAFRVIPSPPSLSLGDIHLPATLLQSLQGRWAELYAALGPFGPAVKEPVDSVLVRPVVGAFEALGGQRLQGRLGEVVEVWGASGGLGAVLEGLNAGVATAGGAGRRGLMEKRVVDVDVDVDVGREDTEMVDGKVGADAPGHGYTERDGNKRRSVRRDASATMEEDDGSIAAWFRRALGLAF